MFMYHMNLGMTSSHPIDSYRLFTLSTHGPGD